MTAVVAPITALLIGVALLLMGNGLQGTLLPIRADLEAFSTIDIGILGSSYFFGFALGCLGGPWLVRRAGHIRTFAAIVAIASSIVLAHALITNAAVWWGLRAGSGFCFAVLYMVIESWLNERATNENRGLIFSIYTIINLTVITVGQMMLILADPADFVLFGLASILVSLAAVPVALTRAQAPAPIDQVKIRIRTLYHQSPVGVMGCATVGLANGAFWALGPIFAQRDTGDTTNVALFMSIAVIAGAVGQWPLGRWSDRIDRRKVIVLASAGSALAAIIMTWLAHSDSVLLTYSVFLFGFFAFPLYALSIAHMNDFVQPENYVETASGLLLVYAAGAVAGPLLASLATDIFGIGSLFAYTALIHIALVAFAGYRMRQRTPAPVAEHIAFADALRVAQTVAPIDPLSESEHSAHGEESAPSHMRHHDMEDDVPSAHSGPEKETR